jgi:hypothetical protein
MRLVLYSKGFKSMNGAVWRGEPCSVVKSKAIYFGIMAVAAVISWQRGNTNIALMPLYFD